MMTVVPNQANDMMDIGRLQGFEVIALKNSLSPFSLNTFTFTFTFYGKSFPFVQYLLIFFLHLVSVLVPVATKEKGNKSFWRRRLSPHTLSTQPIHLPFSLFSIFFCVYICIEILLFLEMTSTPTHLVSLNGSKLIDKYVLP